MAVVVYFLDPFSVPGHLYDFAEQFPDSQSFRNGLDHDKRSGRIWCLHLNISQGKYPHYQRLDKSRIFNAIKFRVVDPFGKNTANYPQSFIGQDVFSRPDFQPCVYGNKYGNNQPASQTTSDEDCQV